ncbi:YisV [Bacillus atrophaeus UCMB-5137]|nr:YisV [Bacillus atrophaeus UCMB-5137]
MLSKQRRQEMIRLTTNERMPIIEDDAYGDLWFEESRRPQ